MKKQNVLIFVAIALLLLNISLLYLRQQDKSRLERAIVSFDRLEKHHSDVELMFYTSKELTVNRLKYEQHYLGNFNIYIGSNRDALMSVRAITDRPKLVFGLNQNMCSTCVDGALSILKEFFSDYETNPNIICIADIEQRFKNDYFGKKVISFHQKDDFPLYEIETAPYFFILDKDLCVKLLLIHDIMSPELTKEYLKTIKERYSDM